MGNVIQEGVAGAQGTGGGNGAGQRPLKQAAVFKHQLGKPVGAGDQIAVEVSEQQRNIQDISVDQGDAQSGARLLLHLAPVGDRVGGSPVNESTAGLRSTCHQDVVAQKCLVGRMGGVGLVLINPRGGGVVEQPHIVCGPEQTVGARLECTHLGTGEHHEIGCAAGDVEGIVGLEGNDDRTTAAFADQIKTMVKELTKEGEQRVIGS